MRITLEFSSIQPQDSRENIHKLYSGYSQPHRNEGINSLVATMCQHNFTSPQAVQTAFRGNFGASYSKSTLCTMLQEFNYSREREKKKSHKIIKK